jgi:ABC-type phosphate transport system auxiliary subunit
MQAQRKLEEATGGMDFGAMNIRLGSEAKEPEDAAGKARKAVREAAAARRELDRATEQEVRAMLSKEQQSRLPEKKERQDGEWEMHGGVEVEIEEGE